MLLSSLSLRPMHPCQARRGSAPLLLCSLTQCSQGEKLLMCGVPGAKENVLMLEAQGQVNHELGGGLFFDLTHPCPFLPTLLVKFR